MSLFFWRRQKQDIVQPAFKSHLDDSGMKLKAYEDVLPVHAMALGGKMENRELTSLAGKLHAWQFHHGAYKGKPPEGIKRHDRFRLESDAFNKAATFRDSADDLYRFAIIGIDRARYLVTERYRKMTEQTDYFISLPVGEVSSQGVLQEIKNQPEIPGAHVFNAVRMPDNRSLSQIRSSKKAPQ